MSETSGTNKINNSNKSEQLFNKKNLNHNNEQINQQQQQAPHTLPRVYMIKVLDKKQEENQDYNTVLIGGNNSTTTNNNNTKKMKNKLNNSLVIEDMEEEKQQEQQQISSKLNTARNGPPQPKPLPAHQIQNKSKKLTPAAEMNGSLNTSITNGAIGGTGTSSSSLISITNLNSSYLKENSVVQVNEKLLNRGIQTENHGGNSLISGANDDLINKSGSNILLLSMSHSSSLNSSRVTSSADLSSKQGSKLK